MHFAPNYQGRLIRTWTDGRGAALLKIRGSTFENLGYHQIVTALSKLNADPELNPDLKDF